MLRRVLYCVSALLFVVWPGLCQAQPASPFAQVNVVRSVMPAVVGIGVDKRSQVGYRFSGNAAYWDAFQKYYQDDEGEFKRKSKPQWRQDQDPVTVDDISVVGSGFIISKEGSVATAQHVIDGQRSVYVTTHDNRVFRARVVRESKDNDVALLQLEGVSGALPTMPLGNSDQLDIAEPVIAIGNPFGITFTVTSGIVSALNRKLGDGSKGMIQTDASLNPGNSGGPLLNLKGEVVGVSDSIYSPSSSRDGGQAFNIGLAFAVPINRVRELMSAGGSGGRESGGVYLGISLANGDEGPRVQSVDAGSPASRAGLKAGDLILGLGGRRVADSAALSALLREKSPGEQITLTVQRGEDRLQIKVRLARRQES